jgi:hypothetical protein
METMHAAKEIKGLELRIIFTSKKKSIEFVFPFLFLDQSNFYLNKPFFFLLDTIANTTAAATAPAATF